MVQLKKKVTLRTKITDTPSEPQKNETPEISSVDSPKKSNKKWFIGVAIILVLVIGFFLIKPSGEEKVISNDISETIIADNQTEMTEQSENTNVVDNIPSDSQDPIPASVEKAKVVEDKTPETVVASSKKTNQGTASQTTKQQVTEKRETLDAIVGTIDEKAVRVIRGDFGNGEERKRKLGSEYNEIQSRVNKMYKEGLVF